MTIIPFEEALRLLDRAYGILIQDAECNPYADFHLSLDEDIGFLRLESSNDEGLTWSYRFDRAHNETVKIDGDRMTLAYDTCVADDLPAEIEIKLMVPMLLELPRDEIHKHQCRLESSLNRIFEACGDSSNLPVIRDHARAAKEAFDWLDNFAVLKLPSEQL